MTRESFIQQLISEQKMTVKGFARSIGMPYTTLLGMLKNGLGKTAVDNVIKVCKGLDITVEGLINLNASAEPKLQMQVSRHERLVVVKYREKLEMQPVIDKLLDIPQE